jgi:Fe-S-cluster containining protein
MALNGVLTKITTPSGVVHVQAELRLPNSTLKLTVAIPDRPAGLADLVPLARKLTNRITRRVVQDSASCGQCVSCRKGCSACCHYLVPLSVPEMLRLGQEISALPETFRGPLLARFDKARLKLQAARSLGEQSSADPESLSQWYAGLNLPCPFLVDNACGIYDLRPLSCREHLVTSDPQFCQGHQPEKGLPLAVPSVANALAELACEMEDTPLESALLATTFDWLAENQDRVNRRWHHPILVERLLSLLQRQIAA